VIRTQGGLSDEDGRLASPICPGLLAGWRSRMVGRLSSYLAPDRGDIVPYRDPGGEVGDYKRDASSMNASIITWGGVPSLSDILRTRFPHVRVMPCTDTVMPAVAGWRP
jgi:hypothetical protein